jgi:TonB-linked SusC/RagA family outer membrane protein
MESKNNSIRQTARMIVLVCLALLLAAPCVLYAQNGGGGGKTLTGTVTDGAEPVIGASVLVKGTTNGTITDVDGRFTLAGVPADAVLQVSYIGYLTQEIAVGGKSQLAVTLKEDSQQLEEVVVVGYGTQKKVTLTGSVSQLTGENIASRASTDVRNALQGQMAGVAVLRSGGQPGAETSGIRVRGFSSAGTATALVLIDGVEGDIALLNPDDVESVSVLKDAASASIYGARAAAGVILITTKKGADSQKATVSYSGSLGVNTPGLMPQRISSWEEQTMINLSRINSRGTAEMDAERSSWVGNPNYNYRPNGSRWEWFTSENWLDEGTRDYTIQQNHSVSLRGGTDKTRYYVSAAYYTKNGILKYGSDEYSRYSFRSSIDAKLSPHVDLSLLAAYEGGFTVAPSYGQAGILAGLYNSRGRQSIYLPEEDTNYADNPYSADLQVNMIEVMKNGGDGKTRNEKYTGKVNLSFHDIIKGLKADVNLSRRADYYNRELDYHFIQSMGKDGVIRSGYEANNPNRVAKTKYYAYQDKAELLLNYDYRLDRHAFHALGGASYERYYKDQMSGTAMNLLSNDFYSFNYYDTSTATNSVLSDLIEPWKMVSLFGRVNYNYAERYLFEANIRYDGSSRLAPGKRFGAFPSFAAGWRIGEEKFFVPLKSKIDNLKLRASWGKLGNSDPLANMSMYPYIGTIENSTIMGKGSYYQSTMASQDITWEIITSTDIGFDLAMLDNRLNVTADYYWKYNNNMLSVVQVAHTVGVTVPKQNVGQLKTWGWELAVKWQDKIKDFSYSIGLTLDDSQNKLLKYDQNDLITADGSVAHLVGYPLNTIWGYKTDGFWSSADEYTEYKAKHPGYSTFNDGKIAGGDVKYVAQGNPDHAIGTGDGTVENHGDLVYMGTTNGRYLFGINLTAAWKGFDCLVFFQGVGKRTFFIDRETLTPFGQSYLMPWTIHQDYWTENNPDAYHARLYEGGTYNYWNSDRYAQNGAYIRLKNIQLGYTVNMPKHILQNLRIYISGSDVWEHSNVLKAFDPESGQAVSRSNYYPFFRTWTMGVNITF